MKTIITILSFLSISMLYGQSEFKSLKGEVFYDVTFSYYVVYSYNSNYGQTYFGYDSRGDDNIDQFVMCSNGLFGIDNKVDIDLDTNTDTIAASWFIFDKAANEVIYKQYFFIAGDAPIGIKTTSAAKQLLVYPNPVEEYLSVNNKIAGEVEYSVYSITGAVVANGSSSSVDNLYLGWLNPGQYHVVLKNNGDIYQSMILKK